MEISKKIAKGIYHDGRQYFDIKVINKTSTHVMNVKAELHRVVPVRMPGGILSDSYKIPLKRNEIFTIGKFDHKDKEAHYAFRFCTFEDITNVWKDNAYLVFIIFVAHPVSGFGQVFRQEFDSNSLIEGDFKFGDTMEIVRRNP